MCVCACERRKGVDDGIKKLEELSRGIKKVVLNFIEFEWEAIRKRVSTGRIPTKVQIVRIIR